MNPILVALFVAVVVSVSGCKTPGSAAEFGLKDGHFGGFLLIDEQSKSREVFVSGDLKVAADGKGFSLALTAPYALVSTWQGGGLRLSFTDGDGILDTASLAWDENKGCFEGAGNELCYQQGELIYSAKTANGQRVLILDAQTVNASADFEKPKTYSVAEVVALAKSQSFNSRIAFSVAQQSRDVARTDHLNLLPHVSLGDVFTLMAITTEGLIRAIGDLAPFLLPSRWLQAGAASDQADSDHTSYLIMKADSGNIAEGLSYNLLRDERVLAVYQSYEQPIANLVTAIEDRERLGILPPGSSTDIETVLNSLKETENGYRETLREEKISLARAIGLHNPDGVSDVTPGDLPELKLPAEAVSPDLQDLVVERALELKQFDDLISIAQKNIVQGLFYFIDPNPQGTPLGFGLPTSIATGADRVTEIRLQKDNERAALLASLGTTVGGLGSALDGYQLADRSLTLQKQRIELMNDQLLLGISLSVTDLQNAFQNVLKSETDRSNAEFLFYVSLGKLNRLLYVGSYGDVKTQ